MTKKQNAKKLALFAGATALAALTSQSQAQSSSDVLINKLEEKGILSADDAKQLRSEAAASETNLVNSLPASKWKIADSIKSIGLFGDVRLRYEYRAADNPIANPSAGASIPAGSGTAGDTYARERFRYALRFGIRGDLLDDWNYGIRLETSANPRSQFVSFADDTGKSLSTGTGIPALGGAPSDKTSDGINVGQVFLGWHAPAWLELTAGKMANPLYTTPMVWSPSLSPEGAFEKIKYTAGPVDFFVGLGQFDYQDPNPARQVPISDTFLLANQIGANVRLNKDTSFKVAPVLYVYVGHGNPPAPNSAVSSTSLYAPFVGQGDSGAINSAHPFGFNDQYNQIGIDNLLVLEVPAEFDFKIHHTPLGTLQARVFGDFAYNLEGDDRARAAYAAAPAAFPGGHAVTGQDMAYQVGFGIGSDGAVYGPTQGLVYGSTSKRGTWEARAYWQHTEQYAVDVNLPDADFFEGRANLEGFYTAFAYSISDAIIGTVRWGLANQINGALGTGGSNPDLPMLNPVRNYQIFQADLTWRF